MVLVQWVVRSIMVDRDPQQATQLELSVTSPSAIPITMALQHSSLSVVCLKAQQPLLCPLPMTFILVWVDSIVNSPLLG